MKEYFPKLHRTPPTPPNPVIIPQKQNLLITDADPPSHTIAGRNFINPSILGSLCIISLNEQRTEVQYRGSFGHFQIDTAQQTPMNHGFRDATDGVLRNDKLLVPPCLEIKSPHSGFNKLENVTSNSFMLCTRARIIGLLQCAEAWM